MTGNPLIAVAYRASKRPVAVHDARSHTILGLFRIFAALVLRHGCKDVFLQFAIGIVTEFDAG
nr:hypothetical protein [Allopusillimonas ginsengisoli]